MTLGRYGVIACPLIIGGRVLLIAVIAPGNMGAAVGQLLVRRGFGVTLHQVVAEAQLAGVGIVMRTGAAGCSAAVAKLVCQCYAGGRQHQAGAVREAAGHIGGGPHRQLGLPGTPAAGQGQQPGRAQQALDLAQFLPAADEAGHLGGQVGQLAGHGSGLLGQPAAELAVLTSPFQNAISSSIDAVSSPLTRVMYGHAMGGYFDWWEQQGRPAFARATVQPLPEQP